MINIIFTTLISLCLFSCTTAQTTKQHRQEESSLMKASQEWSKSFSTEGYFGFISAEGIMMAPGQPLLRGHKEIRNTLKQFQALPGFNVTWIPQEVFVSKSRDLGDTIDKMLISFNNENGEKIDQYNKVVSIWKKDSEGEWKVAVDMWNEDPTLTSLN